MERKLSNSIKEEESQIKEMNNSLAILEKKIQKEKKKIKEKRLAEQTIATTEKENNNTQKGCPRGWPFCIQKIIYIRVASATFVQRSCFRAACCFRGGSPPFVQRSCLHSALLPPQSASPRKLSMMRTCLGVSTRCFSL